MECSTISDQNTIKGIAIIYQNLDYRGIASTSAPSVLASTCEIGALHRYQSKRNWFVTLTSFGIYGNVTPGQEVDLGGFASSAAPRDGVSPSTFPHSIMDQ